MASTRIPYQDQAGLGFEVADYVNAVEVALAKGRRLKPKLDAAQNGSDYASLAAELGGGATTQNAQDLWGIVSSAQAALDSAQIAELSRLDKR